MSLRRWLTIVAAVGLAAVVALVAFRYLSPARRMARAAGPVLMRLQREPATLPTSISDDVVAATLTFSDQPEVLLAGEPQRVPHGSLRLGLTAHSRLTTQPDYWVFVFDADFRAVYWAPVGDPRSRRGPPGVFARLPSATATVALPYHARGWVGAFSADPAKGPDPLGWVRLPAALSSPRGGNP